MMRSIVAATVLILTPFAAFADSGTTTNAVAENAPQAWQPENGDVIKFDVLRKGKPFGSHEVRFTTSPDGDLEAVTEVSLRAGLGPITVFKYELNSSERWSDGQLVSVVGQTNDDGKKSSVTATREGDRLIVDGTDYQGPAPLDIIPSSHWNIREAFSTSILSTESGELLKVDVTEIGPDTVTVGGQEIPATHYRMKSKLNVDLWYDDQNRWVKLSFEARGQLIEYQLTRLY